MDALEDKEIALIGIQEERKRKIAELSQLAKEEQNDQKRKLSLLNEESNTVKQMYAADIDIAKQKALLKSKEISYSASDQSADAIANETKEISLLKEKLGLKGKDVTDEQLKEAATLLSEENRLYAEMADQLKAISREKNKILKSVTEEIELEKAKAAQVAITNADISNLKIPDFSKTLSKALIPLKDVQKAVIDITKEVNAAVESALESLAVGFGSLIGSMVAGTGGVGDIGSLLLGNFADLAINLGKIAIGVGITIDAIKAAFKSLGGVGAVVAGIALVALGTYIKSSLSSAVSGGSYSSSSSSGSSSSSSGGLSYDTRSSVQPIDITITGKLTADGKGLALALKQENIRINAVS
jgi:hypothetical protein